MIGTFLLGDTAKNVAVTILLLLGLTRHTVAGYAQEGKTQFVLGFWGDGASQCDTSLEHSLYAAAMYDLTITILPNGQRAGEVEYAGITDWSWPSGLIIRAALRAKSVRSFTPSSIVLRDLKLEYYVTHDQAVDDSIWRASGKSAPCGRTTPQYHFAFQTPPDWANSYLCLSAEWEHPLYGHLSADQAVCAKVVEPCSESATAVVRRSYVLEAYGQRKPELAVLLADSLVPLGWHDGLGLAIAQGAAVEIGRYDDAIRFLDINFETNHTLSATITEPLSEPTDADRQLYQRNRTRLVNLKNQQQQH